MVERLKTDFGEIYIDQNSFDKQSGY
jgi:hypothetical protein